jgi:hypothetical protein
MNGKKAEQESFIKTVLWIIFFIVAVFVTFFIISFLKDFFK